eukprot:COSAG06_NODE_58874_length_276_cov_0.372881_1_plen_58_part_10
MTVVVQCAQVAAAWQKAGLQEGREPPPIAIGGPQLPPGQPMHVTVKQAGQPSVQLYRP